MTANVASIGDLVDQGLAQIQTGPFGSQLHSYDYVPSGVPVVPTEAIRERRIDLNVCPHITPEKASSLARHNLLVGDILFARRGVQATGHIGVVRDREEGFICGTGAIRLRVFNNSIICAEYLSHLLADQASIAWFKFHAIGATMPNLNEGIICSFPLHLPPYQYQRTVSSLLSSIDDKIELNKRMNETLESMAQAIYRDWFVDFGPVRRKLEGVTDPVRIVGGLMPDPARAAELAALFPDGFGDDGLPLGWQVARVEDLLELSYGKSMPKTARRHGDIPVYGSGGIGGYHDVALSAGPGIIVGRKGTVGSLFWESGPFFPIDTVFYVVPKLGVSLNFAWEMLGTLGLSDMNTDAAVPGLNRSNVYRLEVPRAPAFVMSAFEEIVGPLRAMLEAKGSENRTLAETRDYLLPRLMSGEVRVGDRVLEVA